MANTNASDTDLSEIFTYTCNTYFEHIPYPWQSAIGNGVINSFSSPIEPIKQLCVRPKGVKNNLIFTTTDAALKVFTLFIALVISLGADQSKNLNNRVVAEAWLTSFHLEKLDATTMGEVHSFPQMLHPQVTVVIFSYPHCIQNSGSKITDLLISHPTLLQFLVVGELHIFTHLGKSFREEFENLN